MRVFYAGCFILLSMQPLLVMFLGSPGSGKSYFARRLAEKIQAVRLNGDSMRMALYGSVEGIAQQVDRDRDQLNKQTFGAIDYAVAQILAAGHSVVYDAHHNKRSIRAGLEMLAGDYAAVPIVVWVKTPYAVALKRGLEREATADQRRLSEEKMKETMERHMANFDEPVAGEKVITIDGLLGFEEQFASYEQQLMSILGVEKLDPR